MLIQVKVPDEGRIKVEILGEFLKKQGWIHSYGNSVRVGRGCFLRSLYHLAGSSGAKDRKNFNKVKRDRRTH